MRKERGLDRRGGGGPALAGPERADAAQVDRGADRRGRLLRAVADGRLERDRPVLAQHHGEVRDVAPHVAHDPGHLVGRQTREARLALGLVARDVVAEHVARDREPGRHVDTGGGAVQLRLVAADPVLGGDDDRAVDDHVARGRDLRLEQVDDRRPELGVHPAQGLPGLLVGEHRGDVGQLSAQCRDVRELDPVAAALDRPEGLEGLPVDLGLGRRLLAAPGLRAEIRRERVRLDELARGVEHLVRRPQDRDHGPGVLVEGRDVRRRDHDPGEDVLDRHGQGLGLVQVQRQGLVREVRDERGQVGHELLAGDLGLGAEALLEEALVVGRHRDRALRQVAAEGLDPHAVGHPGTGHGLGLQGDGDPREVVGAGTGGIAVRAHGCLSPGCPRHEGLELPLLSRKKIDCSFLRRDKRTRAGIGRTRGADWKERLALT
ncbi:MAG: hypothetical protein UX17_C0057G0005 [Parcubacteria group bacterium GW2011_GWC2_45_7]|nr:MAG: hypothetical protein UX17_C0057G0005 [Parcubacteria group bacterium GW2011_GWC2_45_7]KKU73273.1 MAG: hypothetical protein UX98_C0009G0004 [Parcubacteria group bacterium GW2011_GWA2_47_26]